MTNESAPGPARSSFGTSPARNVEGPDQRNNDQSFDQPSSSDVGMRILANLLAGIICYGGLGWLLDKALNTNLAMPIGMVVGLALSLYAIIRKYGSDS